MDRSETTAADWAIWAIGMIVWAIIAYLLLAWSIGVVLRLLDLAWWIVAG